ncbi:MAG: TIGR01777 family oxidoreductase [Planctomycetota bacterium]|nr:TIGR01777 family oxidoreductase [Planctomycetota bacterium]
MLLRSANRTSKPQRERMLFEHSSEFSCPVSRLFSYHEQAGAINRLIPPWEPASIVSSNDSLLVGSLVAVKNKIGPIYQTWNAEHTEYVPNELFVDELRSGPFARWKHEHRFVSTSDSASRLTDRIELQLHAAPMSNVLHGWVESKLKAMFRFRHRITADDLKFAESLPTTGRKLRIGVSGSSGMIGRRTIELARVLGIDVVRSIRPQSTQAPSRWPRGVISAPEDHLDAFEDLDAWIHLAGAGIAEKRWTNSYKQAIKNTRVDSTKKLVARLSQLQSPPKALICASGIGIFGNRGDERLDESSSVEQSATGDDFLAQVAREWEAAAMHYSDRSGRVALARFGVVLHPRSGALSKMLLPFKLGTGGPMGSGKQYWPWVHIDDAASILLTLALASDCNGPVHVVAPECVTNRDFSAVLAKVLHRPSWLPAPALALRIALGEMADALLLASARAVPKVLLDSGYQFRFPTLESALRNVLGSEL